MDEFIFDECHKLVNTEEIKTIKDFNLFSYIINYNTLDTKERLELIKYIILNPQFGNHVYSLSEEDFKNYLNKLNNKTISIDELAELSGFIISEKFTYKFIIDNKLLKDIEKKKTPFNKKNIFKGIVLVTGLFYLYKKYKSK